MNFRYLTFVFLILLALAVGACSGTGQTVDVKQENALQVQTVDVLKNASDTNSDGVVGNVSTIQESASKNKNVVQVDEIINDTPMANQVEDEPSEMGDPTPNIDLPAYFTMPLISPATGETFVIEDFKGNVVLVETLTM